LTVSKTGRKAMLSIGYGNTQSARKPRNFNVLGGS
jgi:hypothetical protein